MKRCKLFGSEGQTKGLNKNKYNTIQLIKSDIRSSPIKEIFELYCIDSLHNAK